jgi:F-type H+-transporting ATPase subunit gamma
MANVREMRLRIRSVKSISQVTRALQAVSASKVRKAVAAMYQTRPYASKAWNVLQHLAEQPGHAALHPLLQGREQVRSVLVLLITGDRGLAGGFMANVVRFTLQQFGQASPPVRYITVGRKGRDLMLRRRQPVLAEFSGLPAAPSFADTSAIGRLAVDEYLAGRADAVYIIYTQFINMARQEPIMKRLLPLETESREERVHLGDGGGAMTSSYAYEAGTSSGEEAQLALLDQILPRFTALQVYQAILESAASEHAARMLAMKNASDSAIDLIEALQLAYNKVRQQNITNEMLDIAGGAEALAAQS